MISRTPSNHVPGEFAFPGGPGISEGEGLYRLLVDRVQDYAIFALDPEGNIVTWNAGAERLKGYAPKEIVSGHFSAFYPPEAVAAGKPARLLHTAARDGHVEDEGWRVRKDGSLFWASVVITALRDGSGTLVGFAKVTRDLTERRAAQERASADARRIAEVEAASRAKSEFLTALSHELRTPINATLGYADLLEMGVAGPASEQQREYLQRIQASQRHLLGIITDLLNFSRIAAGEVNYNLVPVSVHQVVETVLPMVEPQALTKWLTPCTRAVSSGDRCTRLERHGGTPNNE